MNSTTQTSPVVPGGDRLRLLRAAAQSLMADGWAEVRARHCPEYRQPQPVVVPELHVPMQPDVCASHPARPTPLIACVGASADLQQAATGRRWQALAAWAANQHATFVVYVHARDYARARTIATRWHVADCVRALPSTVLPERQRHHQPKMVRQSRRIAIAVADQMNFPQASA